MSVIASPHGITVQPCFCQRQQYTCTHFQLWETNFLTDTLEKAADCMDTVALSRVGSSNCEAEVVKGCQQHKQVDEH